MLAGGAGAVAVHSTTENQRVGSSILPLATSTATTDHHGRSPAMSTPCQLLSQRIA